MKERQIEAMYRARFDERRHATEALDALFSDASAGRNTAQRAWLIAVAHPRIPRLQDRLTQYQAVTVLSRVESLALTYAGRGQGGIHPFESLDRQNPRIGLRRWIAENTARSDRSVWKEAWASIHHDGSVTLAAAVGGHRSGFETYLGGWQIRSAAIECAIADFMAHVRATAEATDNDEYDVRVGIDWTGSQPLTVLTRDDAGDNGSLQVHRYTPVEITVDAREPDLDYHWHVHDLAYHQHVSWWRRREPPTSRHEVPHRATSDPGDAVVAAVAVRQALARLGPRQRAVLILRYFEDLTETRTAEILGISVGTVKSHARDGLARLRGLAPELSALTEVRT